MLDQIKLKNFGSLPDAGYQFAAGLNVIVGENGLGKSQLLKLLYSALKVNADANDLTKTALQKAYADKLVGVFRPDELGRLVKRKQGRERCEVQVVMKDEAFSCGFSFSSQAQSEVQMQQLPGAALSQLPAYFPTRELVTLCPWFGSLNDNYHCALRRAGATRSRC